MKNLETERLLLRPWRLDDAGDLFEYASSDLVGPAAGWKPHSDIAESREIIRTILGKEDSAAVVLKSENKVIGSIGLHHTSLCRDIRSLKGLELGYVLSPSFWGRGIMTEAAFSICSYAFFELSVDYLWCGHFENNLRSRRVCEKCGFTYVFKREITLESLGGIRTTELYYIKSLQNIQKENK